jgi:hypothetical protein
MRSRLVVLGAWLLSGSLAALTGCGKASLGFRSASEAAASDTDKDQVEGNQTPSEKGNNEAKGEGYQFPNVPGGRQLADLLTPSEKVPVADPSRPRRLPFPPAVEKRDLPLPPNDAGLPRLPLGPLSRPTRPRLLPEEPPLTRALFEPAIPQRLDLPAGILVRLPSPDVNQPVPLPVLAQEVPDRASLEDPTGEASVALALAARMPERTNPAPFLRLTLPDPFEHSRVVQLRTPPPEAHVPHGGTRLPPTR